MSEEGPEIIGRELLRITAEIERDAASGHMGKERRKAANQRADALRWALHVSLTGDATRPPGTEVETFLGALKGQEGGTP
ncbi:hypothetical protein ACGFYT_30015 [Streptomyces sp. NPDC048208]|uniref:hypothetical protein n=1 Tax=Streptomyces sp. NPDC048208 TaxID=3365515 RepID=UPI00371729EB